MNSRHFLIANLILVVLSFLAIFYVHNSSLGRDHELSEFFQESDNELLRHYVRVSDSQVEFNGSHLDLTARVRDVEQKVHQIEVENLHEAETGYILTGVKDGKVSVDTTLLNKYQVPVPMRYTDSITIGSKAIVPVQGWVTERIGTQHDSCMAQIGAQLDVVDFIGETLVVSYSRFREPEFLSATHCSGDNLLLVTVEDFEYMREEYPEVSETFASVLQDLSSLPEKVFARPIQVPHDHSVLAMTMAFVDSDKWSMRTYGALYGEECSIYTRGSLHDLGEYERGNLFVYLESTGSSGYECPAGTMFFMSEEDLMTEGFDQDMIFKRYVNFR